MQRTAPTCLGPRLQKAAAPTVAEDDEARIGRVVATIVAQARAGAAEARAAVRRRVFMVHVFPDNASYLTNARAASTFSRSSASRRCTGSGSAAQWSSCAPKASPDPGDVRPRRAVHAGTGDRPSAPQRGAAPRPLRLRGRFSCELPRAIRRRRSRSPKARSRRPPSRCSAHRRRRCCRHRSQRSRAARSHRTR